MRRSPTGIYWYSALIKISRALASAGHQVLLAQVQQDHPELETYGSMMIRVIEYSMIIAQQIYDLLCVSKIDLHMCRSFEYVEALQPLRQGVQSSFHLAGQCFTHRLLVADDAANADACQGESKAVCLTQFHLLSC